MTIRTKILLLTTLTLLLSFAAIVLALTFRPIPRFASSSDTRLKAAAIAAGQVYQEREARVMAAALHAAQLIQVRGLMEGLQAPRPVPGAESAPGAAATSQQEMQEVAIDDLDDINRQFAKDYPIDFIILLNLEGKIIARTGGVPLTGQEAISDNPLVNALLRDKNVYGARVTSVMESRAMLHPLVQDRGRIEQRGGNPRLENGLVIEAVAPVLRFGGINGVVLTGYLVNQSPTPVSPLIVTEAKQALAPSGLATAGNADVLIAFQNLAVTSTMNDGLGYTVPAGVVKATNSAVHTFALGNTRYLAGSFPIRNNLDGSVIAQIVVVEPQSLWRDLLQTVGWPALFALGGALLLTLIGLMIITSRLGRAIRKVNEDVQRIALGDFDTEVEALKRKDEIGQLSASVERLRVTVKQAIERLRRRISAPADVTKIGD